MVWTNKILCIIINDMLKSWAKLKSVNLTSSLKLINLWLLIFIMCKFTIIQLAYELVTFTDSYPQLIL